MSERDNVLANARDPNFTAGLDPVEYLRRLHEGEDMLSRGKMIEHCWHSTGYGTQYLNYPSSGGTEGVQCCRCGLSTTLRYSNERSYRPVEGHGPHWKQETVKREYHPPPDLPACTPAPLP